MKTNTQIAPSILSADFGRLNEDIVSIEALVECLHVDVMDGHFVPNLTFGAPVVRCIKTKLPLDCHLMVEHPENYVDDFKKAGARSFPFHIETTASHKTHGKHSWRIWPAFHSIQEPNFRRKCFPW
jgi:ribulose-phosphate 3-epimerase